MVTSVDPESQAELRLAQAAVVFYLDDLEEVSETLVGWLEVYHCRLWFYMQICIDN